MADISEEETDDFPVEMKSVCAWTNKRAADMMPVMTLIGYSNWQAFALHRSSVSQSKEEYAAEIMSVIKEGVVTLHLPEAYAIYNYLIQAESAAELAEGEEEDGDPQEDEATTGTLKRKPKVYFLPGEEPT